MANFKRGSFVRVGKDVGIIVYLEHEEQVPEDHVGVWYGELGKLNCPKCRTVPAEYCEMIEDVEFYH